MWIGLSERSQHPRSFKIDGYISIVPSARDGIFKNKNEFGHSILSLHQNAIKKIHRFIVTCLPLFLLVGCEDPFSENTIRNKGFIYCGLGQPQTFNPQKTDGGLTADTLSRQIFDRLFKLDPLNFKPVPMLAESWTVSPDGKTYTFHLRNNVEFQKTAWFSPGRPFNASDVVFSFERLIKPGNPFHHIENNHYPWFDSMDFSNLLVSVVALSPDTVQFTLSRPDVSFISTLASSYAVIHSKEYADNLLISGKLKDIDHLPVGTGAFYLDEYKQNRFIRLKRHPQYWHKTAQMEQVVYDISHRGTGALSKLITHECDVLASPSTNQLPLIAKNPDFILSSQMGMNLAYLALNTQHAILSQLDIRQAISLAINRDALIQSVYYGTGRTASSILPPMSWAYDESSKTEYNPQLAINLMAKAGYRHGFSINLLVPSEARPYNPSPQKTAELIRSDLEEIGIQVTVIKKENLSVKDIQREMDQIDMVLTGWIADNGDPDNFLRPHLSCNAQIKGWNISNWCNADFDRILSEAIATEKREIRRELYLEAQAILRDRIPIIPLAHGVYYQAQNTSLKGITLNAFGDKAFVDVSRSR